MLIFSSHFIQAENDCDTLPRVSQAETAPEWMRRGVLFRERHVTPVLLPVSKAHSVFGVAQSVNCRESSTRGVPGRSGAWTAAGRSDTLIPVEDSRFCLP